MASVLSIKKKFKNEKSCEQLKIRGVRTLKNANEVGDILLVKVLVGNHGEIAIPFLG